MKRKLKGLAVLLIAIFNQNCDEAKIPLRSSFPFEVKADYQTNTFVNTSIDAIFDLRPEHIVLTNEYSFSYMVLEGEASISYPLVGKALIEREIYQVEDLRLRTSIVPKKKGEIVVEFTFFDQEGETTLKTIKIDVENTDFDFNVASSSNELTVGDTMDLDFTIDELAGGSNFDISYSLTGVNAEFKDANNVVLRVNQNYDVDKTFKWTLKAIEQGDMEITFTVKNQFGVEKTKTIPIKAVPIDFDFSVEPVATVFELGRPIPIQFLMDSPNSLTYSLSFSANTDGVINIGLGKLQEGGAITISNTNFIANYTPSLSGNSVLSLTITASNGVVKTKQINFQVQQKPVVTAIELTGRPTFNGGRDCPRWTHKKYIALSWQKAPGTTIVSANVTVNGELITKNFAPFISAGNNEVQLIETSCIPNTERNFEIIATITDSNGLVSAPLKNTINF